MPRYIIKLEDPREGEEPFLLETHSGVLGSKPSENHRGLQQGLYDPFGDPG